MKSFLALIFVILVSNHCFSQMREKIEGVFFQKNASELDIVAQKTIQNLAPTEEIIIHSVSIKAYTDTIGSTIANQKLAEQRAQKVYDFFMQEFKDLDSSIFVIQPLGEKNEGIYAHQKAVEIIVYYQIKLVEQPKIDTNKILVYPNTPKLLIHNQTELYTYTTAYQIKYQVRKDTNGNYPNLVIEESVNQYDMYKQKLHTMARGSNLESVYMTQIQSSQLKPKDTVFIKLPQELIQNQTNLGWYVLDPKTGLWDLITQNFSKFYQDSCDCYILPESNKNWLQGVSFNLDIPYVGPSLQGIRI